MAQPASWHARLRSHHLFAPLLALALLVGIGTVMIPGFLHLSWQDGHLGGFLTDILNRAAPLMLVSLGMLMVVAIRGTAISVGAAVATRAAATAPVTANGKAPSPSCPPSAAARTALA